MKFSVIVSLLLVGVCLAEEEARDKRGLLLGAPLPLVGAVPTLLGGAPASTIITTRNIIAPIGSPLGAPIVTPLGALIGGPIITPLGARTILTPGIIPGPGLVL